MSEVNTYDIHIHQGEDWDMTLTILDSNDLPVSLSGYSGKMQIRDKPNGTIYATLSPAPGTGMTITAGDGEIDLSLTHAKTILLTKKELYYDIYIVSGAGTYTPLLKGKVLVELRITKEA